MRERAVGQLVLRNLDEATLHRLNLMANASALSVEAQAERLLAEAVGGAVARRSRVDVAKEIASLSPPVPGAPDAVALLRADRER